MTNLIFITASDILLSILFNLLLANITILLCFSSLFLGVSNTFFTSPVGNENVRLRLTLTIPAGVPITVGKDAI